MRLKAFIDTNVFLDAALNRDNGLSIAVVSYLTREKFDILLTDISIINIHYFLRKDRQSDMAKDYIDTLLNHHTIIPAGSKLLHEALHSDFTDFEDGVQYVCAQEGGADFLITNDRKGFASATLPQFTSRLFYEKYIR